VGWRSQPVSTKSTARSLFRSLATTPTPGVRFRQDNDFFYLTGNESLNAALVMDAATADAHLFLPKLSATEIRYEGPNWLEEADAARTYGFTSIQPLSAMPEFLARRRGTPGAELLWTRLSERDAVNFGRGCGRLHGCERLYDCVLVHRSRWHQPRVSGLEI